MSKRHAAHGEGSVYKSSDPKRTKPWVVQITANGKRRTSYYATQKEALAAKRKMLHELEQGQLVTARDQTVKAYLEQWLEAKKDVDGLKSGTIEYRRTAIRLHLTPYIGHIKLGKLTDTHIQYCYAKLLKDGLSPNTVLLVHGILNTALNKAVKSRRLAVNPCAFVELPKRAQKEAAFLTVEQAKKLLDMIAGDHLECLIVLSIMTGMRQGELLALQWKHIDFEQGTVRIAQSLSYHDAEGDGSYEWRIEEPKTERSKRTLYLPLFVLDMLREHRRKQLKQRLSSSEWQNNDLLFPGAGGGYCYPQPIRRQFKRLLRLAGLPDMPFHSLRHSLTSFLIALVGPKVAQVVLGHSTSRMTMDVYGHASQQEMQEAARLLNEQFRKTGEI